MKAIEQKLAQVFQQVFASHLDVDPLRASRETVSAWDSLRHLELILAIEEHFDVRFPLEDLPKLTNFSVIVSELGRTMAGPS